MSRAVPWLALFGIVAVIVTPVQAVEPLVLYDDFNAPLINPGKWVGGGGGGTEALRQISNNRLRLSHRGYGLTDSNTGTRFSSIGVAFINPSTVTAMRAKMQVSQFEVTPCPTNPSASETRPGIRGAFFNTSTPTLGSSLNDVRANIMIRRRSNSVDPPGILRVIATVFRCTDAGCSTAEGIFTADMGTIGTGESATLLVQWDPDNDRFIFKRNALKVVGSYFLPDSAMPGFLFKTIDAATSVANCIAIPRPVASAVVSVDDVFVNSSAVPPLQEVIGSAPGDGE